jgi:hypothetical protein
MLLPTNRTGQESLYHWVVVRPEPAGQFTAQVVGIPELCATAPNRDEAIEQLRARILEWIATGQLVPIEVLPKDHPVLRFRGWVDPNDPDEQAYLQELARLKAEDLERTLQSWPGHDSSDPLEQEFLADLERFRQEDLEGSSREGPPKDPPCSNTSSTPTT